MNNHIKRVVTLAVLASLAMVLSYLEFLLPPLIIAFPGVKMGLANIVIIFVLFRFGLASATAVSTVRLVLCAILFGSVLTFAYSLAGAVLSLAVMAIAVKIKCFSTVGVSILGGIFHNIGQISIAILLMDNASIGYYFPVLAVSGMISGIFIGLAGAFVLKSFHNVKL